MLECFTSKDNREIERLANEIAGLREDIKNSLLHHLPNDQQIESSSKSPDSNSSVEKKKTSRAKSDMSNPDDCDVMISLNCKTMLPTAQRFRAFLEAHGVKVWLCVNMAAGADFRDEIIAAVDACEVFIPLINEAWCESKECKVRRKQKILSQDRGVLALLLHAVYLTSLLS